MLYSHVVMCVVPDRPVKAFLAIFPPLEHCPSSAVVHVTVDAQGSRGTVGADHVHPTGHVAVRKHIGAVWTQRAPLLSWHAGELPVQVRTVCTHLGKSSPGPGERWVLLPGGGRGIGAAPGCSFAGRGSLCLKPGFLPSRVPPAAGRLGEPGGAV